MAWQGSADEGGREGRGGAGRAGQREVAAMTEQGGSGPRRGIRAGEEASKQVVDMRGRRRGGGVAGVDGGASEKRQTRGGQTLP